MLDATGDGIAQADCGGYERVAPILLEPGDVDGLLALSATGWIWDAEPLATSYKIYRGALSALGYDYVLDCDDSVPTPGYSDADLPPSGDGFVYLISGSAGPTLEGTLGFGTSAERSNFSPCP